MNRVFGIKKVHTQMIIQIKTHGIETKMGKQALKSAFLGLWTHT